MGGLLIHFVQVLLQILVLHTELLVKAVVVRVQVVPGIIRVAVIVAIVPVSPWGLIVLVIVVAVLYGLENLEIEEKLIFYSSKSVERISYPRISTVVKLCLVIIRRTISITAITFKVSYRMLFLFGKILPRITIGQHKITVFVTDCDWTGSDWCGIY